MFSKNLNFMLILKRTNNFVTKRRRRTPIFLTFFLCNLFNYPQINKNLIGIVSSQRACEHCVAGNPNMDHSEDNYARKHVWTNRVEPNSSLSYLKKCAFTQ